METADKNGMRLYNGFSQTKSETYTGKVHIEHLQPLPHSRKCSNHFGRLKIEVVNNICSTKRKFDDSCLDETYETPAKRFYSPKTVSPDLGCVIDSCSPLPKQNLVSSSFVSQSLTLEGQRSNGSQNKDMASPVYSQVGFKYVESGSSQESDSSAREEEGMAKMSRRITLNLASAFDTTIEDIFCLGSPGNVTDGFECLSRTQNTPVPNSKSGQCIGKGAENRDGECKDNAVTAEGEGDGGYFTQAYQQVLETGKNLCQCESVLLPLTSSPLVSGGKRKLLEGEDAALSPSEFFNNNQAAVCQPISLSVDDCSLEGAPAILVENAIEALEGDVGEVCSFGDPIFESTNCQNGTLEPTLGSEQVELEAGGMEGGLLLSIQECLATLEHEITLDTISETTLPLQVQVKSVMFPKHQASSSKLIVPPQPDPQPSNQLKNRNPQDRTAKRPVIFDREEDWKREKRLYVHLVTRHMTEYFGTGQDVMTELLNLMTHVADQRPGAHGTHWQHPSDLTRRNYQRRSGNMTPMSSLYEWQNYNGRNHQRFATVPKVFERNLLP